MFCECGAKTYVVDSRADARHGVYRRRECPECGRRFSTREVMITKGQFTAERRARAAVARSHRGCEQNEQQVEAVPESAEGLDARARLAALFEGRL